MSECYVCKKTEADMSLCQDCGRSYCDGCFDTPCHDLCSESGKPQFHLWNKDCLHRKGANRG